MRKSPNNNSDDFRAEYQQQLSQYIELYQRLGSVLKHFTMMKEQDQAMFLTDIVQTNSEIETLLRLILTEEINGEGFNPPVDESIHRCPTCGNNNDNNDEYWDDDDEAYYDSK
jgi:hypothetical protein